MKNVLTIAGFDPSSGAGITRDLDTFFALGLHGIALPTAMVVQGPRGVHTVHPVPADAFHDMMGSIQRDVHLDGVKIGVLFDQLYVEALSSLLPEYPEIPVVVDPVLRAKNGTRLLSDRGLKNLVKSIFPKATVITPNIDEASIIIGEAIASLKDMEGCARAIAATGPQAVVIKGGHRKGEPVDLLFDGSECVTWKRRRMDKTVHGTGCVLSSLILAFLAHGYSVKEAFLAAEGLMDELLREAYSISENGYFYASSGLLNNRLASRWRVLQSMREARERLCLINPVEYIPEVQMNIGYALEGAIGIEDVAAFPGRIGHHLGKIFFKGEPAFGASSHVARLILGIMAYFPWVRSCGNLRYDENIVNKARKKGLDVRLFRRSEEPADIRDQEGKSLDFMMKKILEGGEKAPDIIYDEGDTGKEPMLRLFARNPLELLRKMEMIAR